jgi:fluoroquinolone resistance protein
MASANEDSYEDATFVALDASGGAIAGREYCACRFERCDFTEADLSRCVFEDCRFVGCNFSNPIVKGARFASDVFEECKIVGINFYACDQLVFDVEFDRCHILDCNFSDLKMKLCKFGHSDLSGCDFQNAYLVGADFEHCSFSETLFHACDLERASFRGARGYSIDPRANKVAKAVFSVPEVLSLVECFGIRIEDAETGPNRLLKLQPPIEGVPLDRWFY